MYGDAQTASEVGYVARGLKSRHIQFIALGGTIGTGLFLGIGRAFSTGGPLSILLGYTIVGLTAFCMMMCLGEMSTWLPLPGAIPQFAYRYIEPAAGFATGWNCWYASCVTLCAEISAAATIIQYWEGAQHINTSVWIALILVVILLLNVFAVSIYGEAEFVFASIKILAIVGLLILALIIDLGGSPQGRLGFRYWKNPGAMHAYIARGAFGRFLGFWSVMINAAFAYQGIELVAVAAGEAENPRHNIPKAVRRVFWRILFFYVLGALAIGVLIPYNDERLLGAIAKSAPGAARSPWVIAINRASIPALPSIINAVILSSATSSGNAFCYTASRYLFALAQNGQAPKVLLRCTKFGVPIYCVLITWCVGLLTFMGASSGAAVVFTWFQNLTTVSGLIQWMIICFSHIKFWRAMKAQGIDRSTLIFRAKANDKAPYLAYVCFVFFGVVLLFNGWNTIAGGFDYQGFITAYIGIPICKSYSLLSQYVSLFITNSLQSSVCT